MAAETTSPPPADLRDGHTAADAHGAAQGHGSAGTTEAAAHATPPPPQEATPEAGSVEVIWGALPDRYEVAGMTVVEAYRLLREHLGIPRGVRALVNGAEAEPATALRPGDVLEFVRAAGERGGA